jgi:hypothetical protein
MPLLRLHPDDSVAISTETIVVGSAVDGLNVSNDIPSGHKVATRDIASREAVLIIWTRHRHCRAQDRSR